MNSFLSQNDSHEVVYCTIRLMSFIQSLELSKQHESVWYKCVRIVMLLEWFLHTFPSYRDALRVNNETVYTKFSETARRSGLT